MSFSEMLKTFGFFICTFLGFSLSYKIKDIVEQLKETLLQ
jgi:hypothetical protein